MGDTATFMLDMSVLSLGRTVRLEMTFDRSNVLNDAVSFIKTNESLSQEQKRHDVLML